jgi:DNA topoisomerase IA
MNVVIVESPAKAKTINKYLGQDYEVLASYGHVRDLPAKDGSVRPGEDFAMSWEVDGRGEQRLKSIIEALKRSDRLYLATDPDREGEAISWHIVEELKRRKILTDQEIKRVVFNEITRNAVLDAFSHPRDLNSELVEAYLARRALDYLVGFTLSPVLWRKLPGSRSAGRVQSVALRLICDREAEVEAFRSQEYWTIEVGLANPRQHGRRRAGRRPSAHRRRLHRRRGRAQAHQAQSLPTLHHLNPAAGGLAKARLRRLADHASGAKALRGRRSRWRDGRPHNLHANRRRADLGRSHRRHARDHRRRLRRRLPAGKPQDLSLEVEERAGGP